MNAFIDRNGVWTRNVPWVKEGTARTDISSRLLVEPKFRKAIFHFADGENVSVSADELRRALRHAPTRRNGTIVGPFNIDVSNSEIFGSRVVMDRNNLVFDGDESLLAQLERDLVDEGSFNVSNIEDARATALRAVIQRRGQTVFRVSLLEAYDYRCAITDCDIEEALEAAHIVPYRGPSTNHIQNGILLRADLHTLFDLFILSIDPDTLRVVLSDRISDTEYGSFLNGKKLVVPNEPSRRPARESLEFHYGEFKKRNS